MISFALIQLDKFAHLFRIRLTNEAQTKDEPCSIFRSYAALSDDAPRQSLSRLHVNRVVQRYKGLHGRVAADALDGAGLTTRRVEGGHGRIRNCASPKRVQTPACDLALLVAQVRSPLNARLLNSVRLRG